MNSELDKIICVLAKVDFSQRASTLFNSIQNLFQDTLGAKLEFAYFEDQSLISLLSENSPKITFVNSYEAIYLETFFEYVPLFRIKCTPLEGMVLVGKDSSIKHLAELRGLSVSLSINTDFLALNPVILFLLKNTQIINLRRRFQSLAVYQNELNKVIEGEVSATILTSDVYELLNEDVRNNLRILGHFPLMNEMIVVGNHFFNGRVTEDIKQQISYWIENSRQYEALSGLFITKIDQVEFAFLLEGIEGLGYNLKDYIEQYPDLLVKFISESGFQEYKTIQKKYLEQVAFNEKMVKLYREMRESRDRLSSEISKSSENVIIFSKDGKISGVSRGMMGLLKCTRQELIGKDLSNFIKPQWNKPLIDLIYQVDYGLVKSFNVKVLKKDGTTEEAKMDFNVVELQDSKFFLGILMQKSSKGVI